MIAAAGIAASLGGCGLNLNSADLFVLTRTGQGRTLRLLVNDGGTIRCNGRAAKPLPDSLLLRARDLADALDTDAKAKLHLAPGARSVFSYTVALPDGTISFPDTAAAQHKELAQTEQFALQAAEGPCGLSG